MASSYGPYSSGPFNPEKNEVVGLIQQDIKTYKAQELRQCGRSTQIEPMEHNRSPHMYGHLIFVRGGTAVAWEKKISIQKVFLGQQGIHMEKKINLDPNLIPYAKINSRHIIDLSF